MVVVAIAGASTGLGKTILDVFLSSNHSHQVIVLSRSYCLSLPPDKAEIRTVDYSSHESLVASLRGVHTLLSFIGGGPADANSRANSQLTLLRAAVEAGVKRFAPSEYAGMYNTGIDMYAGKQAVWEAALKSGLECTRFANGLFLNFFGNGTPNPPTPGSAFATGQEEALGGLRSMNYAINMAAGTADLPGDGSSKLVLTTTRDVGRFVLAALDLEKWPEVLGMRGDVKTFKEVVAIAERVQGRKFLTKENSVEEMRRIANEQPAKRFYNQVRIAMTDESWGLVKDDLNQEFQDIRPVTVEEYTSKWWSNVDLPEPSWTA